MGCVGVNSYAVSGRCVATAATADNVGAALWNPSSTRALWVTAIMWAQTVATVSNPGIVRTTTRGTQTLTFTPDIDNDVLRDLTPATVAVLDATYSAQPTVAGPYLMRTNLPAAIGSGFILPFPRPIKVPPGTGLGIATPVAVILQPADVTFFWDE